MSSLEQRLHDDLTAAIRSRDEVRSSTLRMALTAVKNEAVSGTEARELSDADVVVVLGREAKKRRESATAYDEASRPELADRERAELAVLDDYLPQQLTDDELAVLVAEAVARDRRRLGRGDGLGHEGPHPAHRRPRRRRPRRRAVKAALAG